MRRPSRPDLETRGSRPGRAGRESSTEAERPGRQMVDRSVDHLFRDQASKIVATLTRIFGIEHLELAEDVVQEALYKALRQWPYKGVPDNPAGWIARVARNQALDVLRRRGNWRHKEAQLMRALPSATAPPEIALDREVVDDRAAMIFACCHPKLPRASQIALTLKVVAAFSVGEIARALLAKEATVAQRIVRAKRRLKEVRDDFGIPASGQLPERLDAVLEVIYLLFNEGYSSHSGDDLLREELCHEARRLVELISRHPATDRPEVHALAALLSFQASRLATRVDADGDLLLLAEQDRSLWSREAIRAGAESLRRSARGSRLTPYHLEAEISACHALAPSFAGTDWATILGAYDSLLAVKPSPIVALNRLVALTEVEGVDAALAIAETLVEDPQLERYYPAWMTLGELLRRAGRPDEAGAALRLAAELTDNRTIGRHIRRRLRAIDGNAGDLTET